MKALTWYHSPHYPTDRIMPAKDWLRYVWIMAIYDRDSQTDIQIIDEYDPLARGDK